LLEFELKELKLSMGMSGDFVEAINYGADVVRVGSAIFGARVIWYVNKIKINHFFKGAAISNLTYIFAC